LQCRALLGVVLQEIGQSIHVDVFVPGEGFVSMMFIKRRENRSYNFIRAVGEKKKGRWQAGIEYAAHSGAS